MSCDPPAPKAATTCGPCSASERNRYFPGRRLTVADYQLEQRHLIERRRLINRAMLGWGVVEGMAVETITQDAEKNRGVVVGPGFALDPRGRELVACDAVELRSACDILWLERSKGCPEPAEPPQQEEGDAAPRHYLVSAHYAERPVDSVSIGDDCTPARCEATHICETVVYSLIRIDACPSGLAPCPDPFWPRGDCPAVDERWWSLPEPDPGADPAIARISDRGTHRQLAKWSLDRLDKGLCRIDCLDRLGPLLVALDDGVPLACVTVGFDCGKPYVMSVDDNWYPRRLASPNPTLFDLIRGCDLTRIKDVGWAEWLPHDRRVVPFNAFAKKFSAPPPVSNPKAKRYKGEPVATDFWLCFTGPVQTASLTADIFAITLIQRDENEDVGEVRRMPVRAIDVAPQTAGDPDGTTRACRPRVSFRFWNGEINPDNSSGFEQETLVEIEVRTAFIIDALGQKVAGGGRYVPSDDCAPGGRFLSSFVVEPSPEEPDGGEADGGDRDNVPAGPPDVKKQDDPSQRAARPPAQEA
ncbi:hypothetical protein BRX37_20240 [Sphingomonas sp. S-NIH.Pt3_0716]|nr:hypothetical protein BRX37_20240 [Sphingomonas sp. S-NIH.Pt3_0716]